MAKQKKHLLDIDDEKIAFDLIGICSHHNGYRLAWNINKALTFQFAQSDNPFVITITKKNEQIHQKHSMFEYYDDDNRVNYYLIKNKENGKFLIPEKPSIDYFLLIEENEVIEKKLLGDKLKQIDCILAVFILDPDTLSSTKNIIL
ncbi:MAG: IPExxxVDY family protein [Crocinitomicaceae bacterium]|nr:IPExxxVDY family protein [Crocinitomicaceae bacterium]